MRYFKKLFNYLANLNVRKRLNFYSIKDSLKLYFSPSKFIGLYTRTVSKLTLIRLKFVGLSWTVFIFFYFFVLGLAIAVSFIFFFFS